MSSEAQRGSPVNHLWRESDGNRSGQDSTHKSVTMGVSRDLRGISGFSVPRSLPWCESLGREENVGFELVKCFLCPSFIEGGNARSVGLRVLNSYTINHHEDDFTPLETIQRFLENELSQFLTTYGIPSEYKAMLPKSNQPIYDALDEFVGLYTRSFSLTNLRLPLPKFFCDVLKCFHVHVSRLYPFGCAKLTTFAIMCKAYGGKPMVELFRGFFNLYPGGQWLTFAKRLEKDVPNVLPKVITRIEDWKGRFFYVQDSIVPKMPFRNFMYVEDDEDLSFLPCELSPRFGTISPSALINNEPPLLEAEPFDMANPDVVERMKSRKCRTKGSIKPPVKRKLVHVGSSSWSTLQKPSPAKSESSTFLTIFDDEEGLLDAPELQNDIDCHLMISNVTPPA
ncbi:hypothetical protein Tco_0290612 [Tanacetum coccineum]